MYDLSTLLSTSSSCLPVIVRYLPTNETEQQYTKFQNIDVTIIVQ